MIESTKKSPEVRAMQSIEKGAEAQTPRSTETVASLDHTLTLIQEGIDANERRIIDLNNSIAEIRSKLGVTSPPEEAPSVIAVRQTILRLEEQKHKLTQERLKLSGVADSGEKQKIETKPENNPKMDKERREVPQGLEGEQAAEAETRSLNLSLNDFVARDVIPNELAEAVKERRKNLSAGEIKIFDDAVAEASLNFRMRGGEASNLVNTLTTLSKEKTESPTPPEQEKGLEKGDSKIRFTYFLNRFVDQFRDGTLPQSFREFLNSNPTSQQYEVATAQLTNLYKDYIKDRRVPSEKIPEFTDKVRDVGKKLNEKS